MTAQALPPQPTHSRPPVCCGTCGNRWSGTRTAHCSGCHETFTALTSFDKHRAGSHPLGKRHCLDPATAGLEDAGRAYPCWTAGGDPRWDGEADD